MRTGDFHYDDSTILITFLSLLISILRCLFSTALLAVRSSNTRHSKCRAAFNFVKTATQSHALDWQIEFEMNIWKTRSRPPQITGLVNGVRGRQAVSRKPLVYGAMQAKLLWQILQLSLARCGYVPSNIYFEDQINKPIFHPDSTVQRRILLKCSCVATEFKSQTERHYRVAA